MCDNWFRRSGFSLTNLRFDVRLEPDLRKGFRPCYVKDLILPSICSSAVAACLVQAVPLSVCERGAEVLATLAARVWRIRHHVVDENLRIAFPNHSEPERAEIAWRMWRHLFLMLAEIARHAAKRIAPTGGSTRGSSIWNRS